MRMNELYNNTLYRAVKANFAVERPWLGSDGAFEESKDAAKAVYFGLLRDRQGERAMINEAHELNVEDEDLQRFLDIYSRISNVKQEIRKGSVIRYVDRYKIKVELIKNYFKHARIPF